MSPSGLEPLTFGLRIHCTTIVLRAHERREFSGPRSRNLTVKSRLLCQLSYEPSFGSRDTFETLNHIQPADKGGAPES